MNEIKLFFKYFYRYIGIIVIVICSNLILVLYAKHLGYNEAKMKYIHNIEKGLKELDIYINEMNTFVDDLGNDEHIKILKNTKSKLLNSHYLELNYVREDMNRMETFGMWPYHQMILFRDNDVVISSAQTSDDFINYYGKFFECDDYDATEFKEMIFSCKKKMSILPCSNLTFYKNGMEYIQNPILFCIYPNNYKLVDINRKDNSFVVIFVISPEQLYEIFNLELYKDALNIELFYDDNIIFSQETILRDNHHKIMNLSVINNSFHFEVDIYDVNLEQHNVKMSMMLWMIFGGGLIGCISVSIILSYNHLKKMRPILGFTEYGTNIDLRKRKSEYTFINDLLVGLSEKSESNEAKIKELELLREKSIIENIILNGSGSKEKSVLLQNEKSDYYFVAVLEADSLSRGLSEFLLFSQNYIEKSYKNQKKSVYVFMCNGNQLICLILLNTNDSSVLSDEKRVFRDIENHYQGMQVSYKVGISRIGYGFENLHYSYVQAMKALFSIEDEPINRVEIFEPVDLASGKQLIALEDMQRITNAILVGDEENVLTFFESMKNKYRRNKQFRSQTMDIYYSLRNILYNLIYQYQLDIVIPEYSNNQDPCCQFDILKIIALKICKLQHDKKCIKKAERKRSLVEFLEKNFTDASLSISSVSCVLGISESYCCQYIKEETGETFSMYLEELRIRQANKLLSDSNLSNEEIAEASGFGSVKSFYRIYKKHEGITPGKYRDSKKQ